MVEKQNEIEIAFALKIEGMHCPNCEGVIERRFGALPGVRRVEVNYRTGKAEVGYEGSLSVSDLNNAVEEEGYSARAWTPQDDARSRVGTRDVAEIGGILAAFIGLLLVLQHFDLMP